MKLQDKITNWIYEYCVKNKVSTLVVGVSGGIDSALVSTLCCRTGLKTIVVSLPINQKKEQLSRATNHINWLKNNFDNVKSVEIDLTNLTEIFKTLMGNSTELSIANSKSRLRMVTLYHISSNENGIVVGTGNKIEDFGVGFFTKYGDGGVDISPIGDLTKSEVKKLATELDINLEIINCKPTDGLWDDDRTDEDQIGATYDELEKIMSLIEIYDEEHVEKLLDEKDIKIFNIYSDFNKKNKHKMLPIPVFKK